MNTEETKFWQIDNRLFQSSLFFCGKLLLPLENFTLDRVFYLGKQLRWEILGKLTIIVVEIMAGDSELFALFCRLCDTAVGVVFCLHEA